MKDVVSKSEGDTVSDDEIFVDDKGFRETPWLVLQALLETHAPVRTVTQQIAIDRESLGSRNCRQVTDAR